MKRLLAGIASLAVFSVTGAAEPVGAALDRPALAVRAPERAVLLGATQVGAQWVAVGERGLVLRSDDGGSGWQQVPVPTSVTLTAVRFADERNGIAVGHGGTVLVTTDGGHRWERRLDGRRIAELMLADAKARQDAAGQKAAEQLLADGPDKPLLDVLPLGRDRALVVGAYGLALATQDGGKTWTSWAGRLDNPKGLHLYAVRQRGSRIVIAGEQGLVLKSDDAGQSFQRIDTPYKGSFFTLELTGEQEVVLAGLRGNVWRTLDGGREWQALQLPMPVSVVASQLAADGTLLLANQAGFVFARRGDAFAPVNRDPLPSLTGLAAGRNGALLALSVQGAMPISSKP
ncbi:YCF48-related protein [Variovorax sp. LjRoot290]|uniref:WD40/YVTN/BNR-like repeat-containing protein n=1 Tax=Variovorax sp. LjRoot290 TaxID=3342316 RepID=UPI003ECE5E84